MMAMARSEAEDQPRRCVLGKLIEVEGQKAVARKWLWRGGSLWSRGEGKTSLYTGRKFSDLRLWHRLSVVSSRIANR